MKEQRAYNIVYLNFSIDINIDKKQQKVSIDQRYSKQKSKNYKNLYVTHKFNSTLSIFIFLKLKTIGMRVPCLCGSQEGKNMLLT